VVDTYLELRAGPDEPFLAAYGRLGPAPFKEALYADAWTVPLPLRGGLGEGKQLHPPLSSPRAEPL
jgi:hypothetical protein